MDIAGLSKLSADTLVLVVSVLGFMVSGPLSYADLGSFHHKAFGFATREFEVTPDRLGVYLPVVCYIFSFSLTIIDHLKIKQGTYR